jgi:hypothetical protein
VVHVRGRGSIPDSGRLPAAGRIERNLAAAQPLSAVARPRLTAGRARESSEKETAMRISMLMAAALAAGALALNGAAAQQTQQEPQAQMGQEGGEDGMKVTGMVTDVDKDANEITVDGKTFIMSDTGGGAAMMPQVGAEVTLFYREEGGQNLITRIGQAEQ